jgi:hypothetical protein
MIRSRRWWSREEREAQLPHSPLTPRRMRQPYGGKPQPLMDRDHGSSVALMQDAPGMKYARG